MSVPLRDYQQDAVERARQAIRQGARNVLICAPTGAGKTQIAAHLIAESLALAKRSAFVVDRLSLIDQTSSVFDRHGIEHGVIQADHPRFRPQRHVQLCSVQTLARRRWPEAQLIIVDEAHTLNKATTERLKLRNAVALGLTATPFTRGLGKVYDAVINVTTTDQLIAQGWLSTYRIYACTEPDMAGVRVVAGEWEEKETSRRALAVVGDVVLEYLQHGEGRKFICSAVDTAHVVELQRQFLAAGINAATYTYKDRDEDRVETVQEFRKPGSTIRGLITVTAASKGFDVPDIGCVIMARPLRKSLTEHIQFMGRGLRIADGKRDCLILDHSGNVARFWAQCNEFFERGISELDDGKHKPGKKKAAKDDSEPNKCPNCRHLHKPAPFCPQCGHEYPRRKAIAHLPGTLKELVSGGYSAELERTVWPQVCGYARGRRGEDGGGMALAIYKKITGQWPRASFVDTAAVTPGREVGNKIRQLNIAYAKAARFGRNTADRQPALGLPA